MRLILAVLFGLWAGQSVVAQEQIAPSEFMDRAAQNTLTFRSYPGDRLVGIEQFLSRSKSVWARADGRCTYGEITLVGSRVCFRYDDDAQVTHCWLPFFYEDRLMVQATNGEVQQVTRITQRPVQCSDALLS
ncbi:MAG: hypothetical protein AB8B58_17310 [Roseobacter sp.]